MKIRPGCEIISHTVKRVHDKVAVKLLKAMLVNIGHVACVVRFQHVLALKQRQNMTEQYQVLPVPSSKGMVKTQSFRDTRNEPVMNVKAFMNYNHTKEWKAVIDRNGKRSRAKGTEQKKARSIRRNGETIVIQAVTVENDKTIPKWEREGYESYNDYIRCRVHRGSYK